MPPMMTWELLTRLASLVAAFGPMINRGDTLVVGTGDLLLMWVFGFIVGLLLPSLLEPDWDDVDDD